MSKIMDNGEIRDMTLEEQAQFNADMLAPPPPEEPTIDDILKAIEAAF